MAGIVDFIELPFAGAQGSSVKWAINAECIECFRPEGPDACMVWISGWGTEGRKVDLSYDALKKALMVRTVG